MFWLMGSLMGAPRTAAKGCATSGGALADLRVLGRLREKKNMHPC